MDNIIKLLYDSINTNEFLTKECRQTEVTLINELQKKLDKEGIALLEELIQVMLKHNDKTCFKIYERGLRDCSELNKFLARE